MTGERINESRQEVLDCLARFRSDYAKHIVSAHHGKPATTCHKCLSLQQGIQSNARTLKEIDQGTWIAKP